LKRRANEMVKGQNLNRPQQGDQIKVEPIRRKKDIDSIKKLIAGNARDSAQFTLGINTNLRASDLLRIRVCQVRDLKPGDSLDLKEKKTGKFRMVTLNKACIQAIQRLFASRAYADDDLIFLGQRGPLTVPSVHRLVKNWCKALNLRGNFGSHSLRKTWGYHQRVTFGVDIPRLMVCFNHSTQRQTLEYLCIQPEEIPTSPLSSILRFSTPNPHF
jgi:integrase